MNDFIKAPDNIANAMTDIYQLKDIEVGKYKVMYGYRLRAGYIGEEWVELDICCGDLSEVYDEMFKIVCTIIKYNIANYKEPFDNIPSFSKIKPYPKDEQFCNKINILYEQAIK